MEGSRGVRCFEDLIAWQKSRVLTKTVYELTTRPPIDRHRRFCEQLEAASLSIMNNIAEGFDRGNRPEFSRFLTYAKGSCGEVRSMAYVALDSSWIDIETHEKLLAYTDEIARIIRGLRTRLEVQRSGEFPRVNSTIRK